jgi:hypothetical protein
VEFTPQSAELWKILVSGYNVPYNYLLRFTRDSIDQSNEAAIYLKQRGSEVRLISLPGDHLTPNGLSEDGLMVEEVEILVRKVRELLNDVVQGDWVREVQQQYALPSEVSTKRDDTGSKMNGNKKSGSSWEHDEF